MPSRDLIRCLQFDARRVAAAVAPGASVSYVVALDAQGRVLFKLPVPPAALLLPPTDAESAPEPPAVAPGWAAGPKGALYDGGRVAVSASRLKLLKVLVEADGPLTAKELTAAAFDKATDVENTRYHIRELRRELKIAFPGFEGEIVAGSDEGYRLQLR